MCWGSNRNGQLGNDTTSDSSTPVEVVGLGSGVVAIAAGSVHTCALTSAGGVKCWGRNDQGQLGDGTTTERRHPVDVTGLSSGVASIVAGHRQNCALTRSGRVHCWGRTYRSTPMDIVGLDTGVTAVTAGAVHDCALTRSGQVSCWGGNAYGQLGDGSTRYRPTPTRVANLPRGVIAVSASNSRTCAVTRAGGIKCWGLNTGAAAGPAVRTRSRIPVDVDESVHQTITLRPSTNAAPLAEGSTVTFTATVSPLGRSGVVTTVRFVVKQRIGERLVPVEQDVGADPSGRAILDWTFTKAGAWNVIAWAPANDGYTASMWSPSYDFRVVPAEAHGVTPILAFLGSETSKYPGTGDPVINYWLGVTNWQEFSPGLFVAAPDLPPCGLNAASRATVRALVAPSTLLNEWCSLRNPREMERFGFYLLTASPQPARVYIEIVDRLSNLTYRSNVVTVSPPPGS